MPLRWQDKQLCGRKNVTQRDSDVPEFKRLNVPLRRRQEKVMANDTARMTMRMAKHSAIQIFFCSGRTKTRLNDHHIWLPVGSKVTVHCLVPFVPSVDTSQLSPCFLLPFPRSRTTVWCCSRCGPPSPPAGRNNINAWTQSPRMSMRALPPCVYLSFHLHGEVLEHFVQVFDAPLQLQDLIVPRLDLVQSLFRSFSINQDLCVTVNAHRASTCLHVRQQSE